MGTIPTPPTFVPGPATTSQMNQVRDAINFWAQTPRCYAYETAGTSIATGSSYTVVPLGGEVFDVVQSGDTQSHDNLSQNSRIVARTTGKYEVTGQVTYASNSTGIRSAMVRKNAGGSDAAGTQLYATTQGSVSGFFTSVPIATIEVALTAGDYIELFTRQTSGAGLTLAAGSDVTFLRFRLVGS